METSNFSPALAAAGRGTISFSAVVSNFAGDWFKVTFSMVRPTESKAILVVPSRRMERVWSPRQELFCVQGRSAGRSGNARDRSCGNERTAHRREPATGRRRPPAAKPAKQRRRAGNLQREGIAWSFFLAPVNHMSSLFEMAAEMVSEAA